MNEPVSGEELVLEFSQDQFTTFERSGQTWKSHRRLIVLMLPLTIDLVRLLSRRYLRQLADGMRLASLRRRNGPAYRRGGDRGVDGGPPGPDFQSLKGSVVKNPDLF